MKYIESRMVEFKDKCNGRDIVLFGASSAARKFLLDCDAKEQVKFIVDNDPKKNNTKYSFKDKEYDVYLPEIFSKVSMDNTVVVITSTYYPQILEQLNKIECLNEVEVYISLLLEYDNYCDVVNLSENKKVMICIGAVCNNRGSEALAVSLAKLCKNAGKNIEVYLSSSEAKFSPEYEVENVDYYIKQTNNGKDILDGFIEAVKQMDLIIFVGADNYTKEYNLTGRLNELIKVIKANAQAKLIMYDLSIEADAVTDEVAELFNGFDYVTVRESISYNNLKDKISTTLLDIPDPAFTLEEGKCKEDIETFFKDKDVVGLNISELIIGGKYQQYRETTLKAYDRLMEYILNNTQYGILLIPHVMNDCDLYALRLIYENYRDNDRVKLIDNESLKSRELKAVIAKCRLYIGARTHTIIAAYSKKIPAITLGYSVKAYGIAKDIFGEDYKKYIVDAASVLEENALVEAFKYMCDNEDAIRTHLEKTMPKYINSVKRMSILFNQILMEKDGVGCCGCGACVQACPNGCITMEMNKEGFKYPVINYTNCIACGKCINVCPVENVVYNEKVSDEDCYCAYSKDFELMKKSSSGGLFSLLAEEILNRNGVVYGVEATNGMELFHSRATTLEEYKKHRKSKYLQSDTRNTYKEAKADLEAGKTVLYTGTPCQIGGLYGFLGKDYDNLYTMDLTCHGVPSKVVYERYKAELEEKYNSKVANMVWRNKEIGWKPNYLEIQFEDGERILDISGENAYTSGFLTNLFLRKSCYDCKYNRMPRVADISVGDYFGYEGDFQKLNKNAGLSLVMPSTPKGKELFEKIKDKVMFEKTEIEYAKDKNYHLSNPPYYNMKREKFFEEFFANKPYIELAKDYLDVNMESAKKG